MAFVNTIQNWLAADGIPYMYSSNINLNNNVSVGLPSLTGVFTLKPRAGYVRIKSNIINKNVNVKVGPISATDGTNTVNIYAGDAASGANSLYYDSTFFFWYDFALSNINITNIATTNNTATFDVEVAGML